MHISNVRRPAGAVGMTGGDMGPATVGWLLELWGGLWSCGVDCVFFFLAVLLLVLFFPDLLHLT